MQILQEIARLNEEIEAIKQNPENPEEHSIFIDPIMKEIARLKHKLENSP